MSANNQQATGIMFSENLPDDLDLEKLEDYEGMDEGDFLNWLDVPGRYLMKCISVRTQDDGDHTPSENVTFKVIGGTPEGHEGKAFMERIYHTAADRAVKLGKRMGVWSEEQHQAMLEAIRAGEATAGPEFSPCVGQDFVVVVKSREYQGKQQMAMDYIGIWRADDERVADFVASVHSGNQAEQGGTHAPTKGTPATKADVSKEPAKQTSRTTTATQKGKAAPATTKAGKSQAPAQTTPAGDVDDL